MDPDKYKVDSNGCWVWLSQFDHRGYGKAKYKGKTWRAHRLSYTLNVGPIPDGLLVRHKCDLPSCVNPEHLQVGTHADNMRDAVVRGRTKQGVKNAHAKLTESQVQTIRLSNLSGKELAKHTGLTEPTISKIRLGKLWTHLPWPDNAKPKVSKKHITPDLAKLILDSPMSGVSAARHFGVSEATVYRIKNGFWGDLSTQG